MAPTHLPAFNMRQSTWSIQQNEQVSTKQDSQSVPLVGLPIPLALVGKKFSANAPSRSPGDSSKDSGRQKALPLTDSTDPPNAGIVIPMHRLLRSRRQTRGGRQAAGPGARRVLMLINPTSAPNRTLEAQRVMFLMRQSNNPLYNVTFANSTRMAIPQQHLTQRQTAQTLPPRTPTPPSKPALQSLSDLNLVDLTFPLRARNNHLGPTHNISASRRMNQTHSLGSSGTDSQSLLSTLQRNRTSHRSFSNQGRPTHPTRPTIFQVTRPTPRSNPRILNLRLQNSRPTTLPTAASRLGGRPAIARRPTPSLTIVRPVSGRRISSSSSRRVQSSGQRTPSTSARRVSSTSGQRVPSSGSRIAPSTSARRTAATSGRRTPTSGRISSRRRSPTRTRDRTIIRARSGVTRRQPVRRPSTISRSGSRQTTMPRRTISQQRRRAQARRRTPPDPFTRRFSAGFQRGSTLLHQPPMDFTSFDGSSRGPDGVRPPPAPGFVNSLALQGGLPFTGGPGPGVFGGAGMFLGGPPGFL